MIEIVCHRGANEYAPENTYASSEICIDWGADFLEIDINTSRDGIPYLFHGPDLSRTTNGSGKIYEHDSSILDQLDCGSWFSNKFSAERIPRLDEFLAWIDRRIKLFLDVKWADLQLIRQLIYEHDMQDNCFFWFGRNKFAHELHALDSSLDLKINVSSTKEVVQAKELYGASIVEFSLQDASQEMISTCRELDVRSMILYKTNDVDGFRRIIKSGADMVNLDHADHFLKVLKDDGTTDHT